MLRARPTRRTQHESRLFDGYRHLDRSSCSSSQVARPSPSRARAGPFETEAISVALVGQSCDRENDPNWSYADILGLDVKISVANSGAAAVTFDPAADRASRPVGRSYRPQRSDSAAAIPPGASRTFVVHFLERDGDLACNVPMALSLDRAVRLDGAPVTFQPISFLASNDDI